MEKVLIERYDDDPEALGRVYAESGRWELIIDKENVPHLYVQCNVEADDGEVVKGMLCIDDMLPGDMSLQDIMQSTFGGKLSPEEEAEAAKEWNERHSEAGIPCPRHTNKHPSSKDAKYPPSLLSTWSNAQIRQTYAFEGLPPTTDLDESRIGLANLRKPKAAA